MKIVSINVMNLCVPCENRCRYCLLSYDGRTTGVAFARSKKYAKSFYDWLKANRPELSFLFGFGYSMEHPDLMDYCHSEPVRLSSVGISRFFRNFSSIREIATPVTSATGSQ